MHSVVYSETAKKDLRSFDEGVAQRIIKKIAFYALQKDLQPFCKALEGFKGKYRFRVGDYRAIFETQSSGEIHILMILRIKHRKDIYDL